jgi:hypothetical protein
MFCHLCMIHTREEIVECLEICAYESDKSLKTPTLQVIYRFIIYYVLCELLVKDVDRTGSFGHCLFSLTFNWCLYLWELLDLARLPFTTHSPPRLHFVIGYLTPLFHVFHHEKFALYSSLVYLYVCYHLDNFMSIFCNNHW